MHCVCAKRTNSTSREKIRSTKNYVLLFKNSTSEYFCRLVFVSFLLQITVFSNAKNSLLPKKKERDFEINQITIFSLNYNKQTNQINSNQILIQIQITKARKLPVKEETQSLNSSNLLKSSKPKNKSFNKITQEKTLKLASLNNNNNNNKYIYNNRLKI